MRIKEISYSRLFSCEGYENKKVGVIIEVQNDDPLDALKEAAEFVEKQSPKYEEEQRQKEAKEKLDECKGIVANPENFSAEQIEMAAKFIKDNTLPF